MTVLRVAMEQWAARGDDRSLGEEMRDAMAELRAVTAGA